jgi:hypothetical protein
VYVRNKNTTRLLSGDVYRSNMIVAAVDLRVGPVGIVIPLRGMYHNFNSFSPYYCGLYEGDGSPRDLP